MINTILNDFYTIIRPHWLFLRIDVKKVNFMIKRLKKEAEYGII